MRSWRHLTTLLTLALAAGAFAAPRSFRVTARGLNTVTIDGGRANGLGVGDRLSVVLGETRVGELEVASAGEEWASCRVIAQTRPIGVGDVVVSVDRKEGVSRSAASEAPAAPRATPPVVTPAATPASPAPSAATPPAPTAAQASSTSAAPAFAALASDGADGADGRPAVQDGVPATPAPVAPEVPPTAVASAAPSPAASATAAPAAVSSGRRFTVKYRSAANVYLAAGRAEGLNVGDRLRVVGGKDATADLEIVYAAERSASCRVLSETRPVRAGDEAVVVEAAAGAPPATPAAVPSADPVPGTPTPSPTATAASPAVPSASPPARPGAPWGRLRGAASVGYFRSWDRTEYGLDVEERTARLDVGVYDIAGQPLSLTVRGRGRQDIRARTLSGRTPDSERNDRLYELALRYEPPSDSVGFEVGRVGVHQFVGIGYLDGFLGRFRPLPNLQVGAFAGRVADVYDIGLDGTGQRYGGFVRLSPGRRYSAGGYDAMLAYVRENAEGDVSREYLSLESRFGGGRWSLSERAELDINTGWRKDATGKSAQLSNVYLSGNLRVTPSAWAFVSYDGRRNYRYYTNRVVPEDVFDDLLHQGLRAGINLSRPGGFGATAGFGMHLKESDPNHPELDIDNAYSANAGVRHMDLLSTGFSAGIDGTGFSNGYTTGGLVVARLGRRFAAGHVLDLSLGRSLYRMKLTEEDRSTQWLRLTGRAELPWRLYLQGDFEYDEGDDFEGPRGFLEVGVLF